MSRSSRICCWTLFKRLTIVSCPDIWTFKSNQIIILTNQWKKTNPHFRWERVRKCCYPSKVKTSVSIFIAMLQQELKLWVWTSFVEHIENSNNRVNVICWRRPMQRIHFTLVIYIYLSSFWKEKIDHCVIAERSGQKERCFLIGITTFDECSLL
jgi:hypothetical protein